ncbi:MAG TPA: hypothetical protein VGK23_01035 [Methanomassiliicoccales archaeon]|jgi:hypothetical protein
MNAKNLVKLLVLAVLMPMLIMAFAVAPAQAKSPDYRMVDNVKVDSLTIDLYQVQLTDEQLAMLNEIVPLQQFLDSGIQYIFINGTAHMNVMAKEKNDHFDVNLHINWHGTIALLDTEKNVVMAIDSKNVQLVLHTDIPVNGDLSQANLWLNFHTNSVFYMGSESDGIDLKMHVILSFSDGQFDLVKVQLPQFADAVLF